MNEPLTISAEVIAAFLEQRGCPQMADFVRKQDERNRQANLREQDLIDDRNRLVDRLHQYEPPPRRQPDVVWTGD